MNSSDQQRVGKSNERFNSRCLSEGELADFNADGYLVLDELLTERGLKEMVDECMASWHAEKGEFDPKRVNSIRTGLG